MSLVGTRIKQIRESRGMTCTALAEQTGITMQGLWNLENGVVGKTYEKLPRIAKALDCRIDDLFPEMDAAAGTAADGLPNPAASGGDDLSDLTL